MLAKKTFLIHLDLSPIAFFPESFLQAYFSLEGFIQCILLHILITKWFDYTSNGSKGAPPTAQKFLDFMQCLGKFDKIVCWRPLDGRRPLLQGILDRPLYTMNFIQRLNQAS